MENDALDSKEEPLDIDYLCRLSRIHPAETLKQRLGGQLQGILHYVRQLEELDVEGIEPTQHAVPVSNVMRPDVAMPVDIHEEAMDNAPSSSMGQFLVPRIVEA